MLLLSENDQIITYLEIILNINISNIFFLFLNRLNALWSYSPLFTCIFIIVEPHVCYFPINVNKEY